MFDRWPKKKLFWYHLSFKKLIAKSLNTKRDVVAFEFFELSIDEITDNSQYPMAKLLPLVHLH